MIKDNTLKEILLNLNIKKNFLNQILDLSLQSKVLIENRDDSLALLLNKRQKSMAHIDIIDEKIKSTLNLLTQSTLNTISLILNNKLDSDKLLNAAEKDIYKSQNDNRNLLLQIVKVDNLMILEINKVR